MSKRPLIYEVIDEEGTVIFKSTDKRESLEECRRQLINYPMHDFTWAITKNGNKVKVLVAYAGDELVELLEDELD